MLPTARRVWGRECLFLERYSICASAARELLPLGQASALARGCRGGFLGDPAGGDVAPSLKIGYMQPDSKHAAFVGAAAAVAVGAPGLCGEADTSGIGLRRRHAATWW